MKDKLRILGLCALLFLSVASMQAQELPWLRVSENQRYLVTEDGAPFFWLGGTAWEMLHRLDREEIDLYLEDRAAKGFTVIQTVILTELDGLNTPNAYGHKPLVGNDPAQLNEAYFQHVDYAVGKAAELGMYLGLLPTWGDKFNRKWGAGPEIFTEENAFEYGKLLGKRYAAHSNIVWILGGDRPLESEVHHAIIDAMARGIRKKDKSHLLTFHPVGAKKARDFIDSDWLDFDMFQSGHSRDAGVYRYVRQSLAMEPLKPVVNGEPLYENIPGRFWEDTPGPWLDDGDVRVSAWRSMLAGAAGYTYGCNDIWQMYASGRAPVISARTAWDEAIHLPGSRQVGHMKRFLESIHWQKLVPDQGLIRNDNPEGPGYMMAARENSEGIILVYTPLGAPVKVDLPASGSSKVQAAWFNPRDGRETPIGHFDAGESHEFTPWSQGHGSDFILVLRTKN